MYSQMNAHFYAEDNVIFLCLASPFLKNARFFGSEKEMKQQSQSWQEGWVQLWDECSGRMGCNSGKSIQEGWDTAAGRVSRSRRDVAQFQKEHPVGEMGPQLQEEHPGRKKDS